MEVNDDGHKDDIFKSLVKKWWDNQYKLYNSRQCDLDSPCEANITKKHA